jgi:hypothetical protein
MSETEVCSPIDLLARVCRREGWALLLRSSGDFAGFSYLDRSEIEHLHVVAPVPGGSRREQIVSGDLLVDVELNPDDPAPVQEAASYALAALHRMGLLDGSERT